MKFLLCLLSLCLPFSSVATPVRKPFVETGSSSLRWYVKRNSTHTVPELPSEFANLSEYGGYYADTFHPVEKVLYLTFDAGYENGNVEKILDTLKEKEVSGAFFVLSHFVKSETDLIERMLNEGHLVCNHTAHHYNMANADKQKMKAELTALENVFKEKTGREIAKFYRPPEGSFSFENLAVAKELGYKTIFWSFAYADWANDRQPSEDSAIKKIRENLHPGAVMLFHPTSSTNAAILPRLIDEWKSEGYRFGTLYELVGEMPPCNEE